MRKIFFAYVAVRKPKYFPHSDAPVGNNPPTASVYPHYRHAFTPTYRYLQYRNTSNPIHRSATIGAVTKNIKLGELTYLTGRHIFRV